MSNSNHKSYTLIQPIISSFVGQKTVIHMSPVLTNKDNIHQKDMNKNHSELSVKVDSNTTDLKSVQSSLSNSIGFPARVEKLENTITHLVTKTLRE